MTDSRHVRRLNSRFSRRGRLHRRISHPIWLISALLALTIQVLIVQTHIHGNGVVPGIGSVSGLAADNINPDRAHRPDRFPVNDDPSNCPLCQEFAHSGGYLHATQIAILAPPSSVGKLSLALEADKPRQHITHPWFGRAPPRETAQA
jgi:hypothetical protein